MQESQKKYQAAPSYRARLTIFIRPHPTKEVPEKSGGNEFPSRGRDLVYRESGNEDDAKRLYVPKKRHD